MSADGSKLAEANAAIYTSTNSGATWISNNVPGGNWSSIAMSMDGSKLVAAAYPGGIYTSTDSGATWISNNVPVGNWYSVASSADGTKLVAANSVGIYTSTDSGATWISNNVPVGNWYSVASSADGCKMIAGTSSGMWAAQTTPSPQLLLTASSTNLALSWLIPSTNFVLQQSSNLISWMDLTNTPTLNLTNLQNQVSLSTSNSIDFFRLSTP